MWVMISVMWPHEGRSTEQQQTGSCYKTMRPKKSRGGDPTYSSPFLSTHRAKGTTPFSASSRPTTAQSATAGCCSTDCNTHTHTHCIIIPKRRVGKTVVCVCVTGSVIALLPLPMLQPTACGPPRWWHHQTGTWCKGNPPHPWSLRPWCHNNPDGGTERSDDAAGSGAAIKPVNTRGRPFTTHTHTHTHTPELQTKTIVLYTQNSCAHHFLSNKHGNVRKRRRVLLGTWWSRAAWTEPGSATGTAPHREVRAAWGRRVSLVTSQRFSSTLSFCQRGTN